MDPFVGQIFVFPFEFTPRGFAPCDGRLMPKTQHTALYALIGDRFGGSDVAFALPNYKGMAPQGSGYFIALTGVFPNPSE
jgi:microcystin-dependent protein